MRVNVVVQMPQPEKAKCSSHGDWGSQQHAEWQGPTLILRRENQEDEEQGHSKDHRRRDSFCSFFLLIRHSHIVVTHLRRHRGSKHFFQSFHCLPGAVARGRTSVYLGTPIQVVSQSEFRPSTGLNCRQGAQRHRLSGIIRHVELANILGTSSIVTFRLDVNLPLASEAIEVIDKESAHAT